jgi:hypothetical protein
MLCKALVSFSGAVSMAAGAVCEITDRALLADLLQAGYIEAIEAENNESKQTAKPEAKKKTKKG